MAILYTTYTTLFLVSMLLITTIRHIYELIFRPDISVSLFFIRLFLLNQLYFIIFYCAARLVYLDTCLYLSRILYLLLVQLFAYSREEEDVIQSHLFYSLSGNHYIFTYTVDNIANNIVTYRLSSLDRFSLLNTPIEI